jgi:hypothetical protein
LDGSFRKKQSFDMVGEKGGKGRIKLHPLYARTERQAMDTTDKWLAATAAAARGSSPMGKPKDLGWLSA